MSRISDAIVGHWKLNDNAASTVVLDDSGNALHGATQIENTDQTATAGKINGALIIDGVGGTYNWVLIPDNDLLSFVSGGSDLPWSVSGWTKIYDNTKQLTILAKGHGAGSEWRLVWSTAGYWQATCYEADDDSTWVGRHYTVANPENVWTHIVATYDGSAAASGFRIYINGVRVDDADEINKVYAAMKNDTDDVTLGFQTLKSVNSQEIDNVMLFNIELTLDDIKVLYAGGHGTEILADLDESRRIQRRPIWQH